MPLPSRPDAQQGAKGRRATVAALLAVVVLVGLLFWVSQSILAHNRLQNCIDSGRRDCVLMEHGTS